MRTLYHNAVIYTGASSPAQAMIVEDDKIVCVGSEREVFQQAEENDARINLQGQFVCPGFNDSHMHLLNFGQSLRMAQLSQHTGSLSGMLDYVRTFLKEHPLREGQWLRGRGWNQDYFTDVHRMPSRDDLDSVSRDIPIMLTRACGHACAVNSKVLEIAGITAETPQPEGGRIGIENGQPDGRFYDNAMELINCHIPTPTQEEIMNMIVEACRALNSFGITSVQTDDYRVFPGISWEMINEAYRALDRQGELTVRVFEQCNFSDYDEFVRFVQSGDAVSRSKSNFWIGPLKMIGDGSLGSRTAHLSIPYADDASTCGFNLFSDEQMNKMISYANSHNLQIAVHAIGDACLDQVLNAFELALKEHPREDHRHGIVHCQITRPDQLKKIRDLNLHVYAQSVFLDYDNHIVEERVGKELASSSYSWKTLLDSGVTVSNGSDCPVELPDVMKGIECAVTRTSMDGTGPYLLKEAFTVREALDSFTSAGAYASHEEKRKGKLLPGYYADFTVLDQNPFETDLYRIHDIRVNAVYLAGYKVFERKDA